MKNLMLRIFCFIAFGLSLQGCATHYSAKEIEAWVIDADTRQPLEGVNVVAHWVLHFGWEGGQRTDLELTEAVTDKNGRFYFPAWGPKAIPSGLPWEARMKGQDPGIIIFKSGYQWIGLSNDRPGSHAGPGPFVRTSDWHGKTIMLKKFNGDLGSYASMVSGALTGVSYGRCGWKQIPRMIVSLNKEAQRFETEKVFYMLPTYKVIKGFSTGENCGSVEEFFKEYLK